MRGGARRGRRGLRLAAAVSVTAAYLVWWVTYSGLHQYPRYEQLPAGAATEQDQASFRLVRLSQTPQLSSADGRDPAYADAHAVWVIAELEVVRRQPTETFSCRLGLVSTRGQRWEPELPAVTRALPGCRGDTIPVGRAHRVETTFQVPEGQAGQLAGVAVTAGATADRTPLLTPSG